MLRKSQAARSFVATALVGATLLFTAAPSGASGLTTFAAAVHYAAGSAPQAMAVADVDKDGHADVVVVNGGASPGLSVLMGQADGSLGAPLPYSGGTSPTAVAVGDVNGDGYPDIVVVGNSSLATVRLNHGDGTFPDSGRSTYSFNFLLVTPAATWSRVAIADVNGDGRPDIVAANTTADLVSVLPGQVGGGFGFARQSQLNTAGGSRLTALALADINADGKVDVAVTDSKNNQLRSIAGAGDGTFSGGGTFAVGTHPTAAALADFNHDSKLDAAVTNSGSDSVSIFIQSGGTYLPAVNDAAGAGARALAVADLDADGNPDLAVAGQTVNSVAVLRGRSDGTFFAALDYATGTNPVAVAATDLNGDTHPDLVTANSGSANVSVLLSVPAAVPGVPTITGASAGQAQATVTWTAPASDGGLPLTGYTVTSNPGNKTATVAGTATSATVGGLTNGTAYTFTLHATNAVGSGAESSPSAPVTPQQATVPGAPTGVVAARGDAQALVTWTVPASDGGSPITGYTVTVTPGGTTVDADVTGSGPATSALVGGLANGTSYTFTVHAANAVGAGTESAASNA